MTTPNPAEVIARGYGNRPLILETLGVSREQGTGTACR